MNTHSAVDSLRNFSQAVNGDFVENQNGGFLTFNNQFGKGNAKAFKLFPGLETVTFDFVINETVSLKNLYRGENCLHFIFCSEGSVTHYFENDNLKGEKINRLQNVIVGSQIHKSSKIVFEAKTKVKLSIITVVDVHKITSKIAQQSQLALMLSKVLEITKDNKEYAYFGEISSEIQPFVDTLIKTNLSGLSNRLINEASVFKTLSYQYSNHGKHLGRTKKDNPLSKSDAVKIIQLSEYISQNLGENISLSRLSAISGLNQKKIQKGFQFYFDETANKFVINLRILKAKELLESSDLSISEIVYQIGLNSRSYFSKIFYQKYGLIPKDYRKYHYLSNPTFQLSYYSDAMKGLTSLDLQDILEVAKEKNAALNITGCLIYHNETFFQVLEGPKSDVLAVLESIKKDKRNTNVKILYQGIRSGRTFGEWNMALVQKEFLSKKNQYDFDIIPKDFLEMANIKNPIANKYMWEKARNFLIVNQELGLQA